MEVYIFGNVISNEDIFVRIILWEKKLLLDCSIVYILFFEKDNIFFEKKIIWCCLNVFWEIN